MHFNEPYGGTAIATSKILLVPYSKHHIATYHTWLQDPSLQTATASEPLTLEQEYAMQQTWAESPDKLTFIICLPLPHISSIAQGGLNLTTAILQPGHWDAGDRMLGDINLFLFEEDSPHPPVEAKSETNLIAEIELMIAHPSTQHRGYGRAALVTFMKYVLSLWQHIASQYCSGTKWTVSATTCSARLPGLAYLRAKIHESNERSLRLFESVGFERVEGGVNYFGEVEVRYDRSIAHLVGLEWYEQSRRLQYGS